MRIRIANAVLQLGLTDKGRWCPPKVQGSILDYFYPKARNISNEHKWPPTML
jgi:hypothetical protein